MRIRPRFSLRTLFLAVLLAAVGCWYFVSGSLFYANHAFRLSRSFSTPAGKRPVSLHRIMAFTSHHRFLPDRNRLRLAILDPRELSWDRTGWRNRVDLGSWSTASDGTLQQHTHPGTTKPFDYERGMILSSSFYREPVLFPKEAPLSQSLIIEVTETDETQPHLNNYILMDISCAEFEAFVNDDSVQEWSVASLEKWLKEHRK